MIGETPELIAKANQAILEAHCLQMQGRSLRIEAAALAGELGASIARSYGLQHELRQGSSQIREENRAATLA